MAAMAARTDFARLAGTPAETLTDVQRAARFSYLQTLSFGGEPTTEVTPGQMGPSVHHPAKLTPARMRRLIGAAHKQFRGVHVECLGWEAFVRRYDRPFTLFYIDPPYWGHEADYGRDIFAREDFARMAEILRGLKGTVSPQHQRPARDAGGLRRVPHGGGGDALLRQRKGDAASRGAVDRGRGTLRPKSMLL